MARDGEAVAKALKGVLRKSGGKRLEPKAVVDAARDKPNHPLYGYFEWDDTAAAESYRIIQARDLIRSVKIEITHEDTIIRSVAYVRDPDADRRESGYVATSSIEARSKRAMDTLNDELTRILSCLARARELSKLFGMEAEFERLHSAAIELHSVVKKRAA